MSRNAPVLSPFAVHERASGAARAGFTDGGKRQVNKSCRFFISGWHKLRVQARAGSEKKGAGDGTAPDVAVIQGLTLHSPKGCILSAPLHARIPKARPCPTVVSPLPPP